MDEFYDLNYPTPELGRPALNWLSIFGPGQEAAENDDEAPIKDSALDKLLDSDCPDQIACAERLQEMLADKQADVRLLGNTLLKMLDDQNQRQLVVNLVTKIPVDAVAPLLRILDDKNHLTAGKFLRDMISVSEGPQSVDTVWQLGQLLTSKNESEQAAAGQLVKLFNHKDSQALACQLLWLFAGHPGNLAQALSRIQDSSKDQTSKQIALLVVELAATPDESNQIAARNLLQLTAGETPIVDSAVKGLLALVSSPDKWQEGMAILRNVDSKELLHQLFNILNNEKVAPAGKLLVAMLREDDGAAVQAFLELRLGRFPHDAADGEQLLKLLTDDGPAALIALKHLSCVDHPEYRHQLVELLADADTRSAAIVVLDMIANGNAKVSGRGLGLLDDLLSTDQVVQGNAQRLLDLLAAGGEKQASAMIIINRLDPDADRGFDTYQETKRRVNDLRTSLLTLVNSPQPQLSEYFLKMLDGSREEHRAALLLLDMMSSDAQLAKELLLMSAIPGLNYVGLLNKLDEKEIRQLHALSQDSVRQSQAWTVLKMLVGGDPQLARTMLAMIPFGVSKYTRQQEAVATSLVAMLDSPEKSELAKLILGELKTDAQRRSLVETLSAPEVDNASTRQWTTMLKKHPALAREILDMNKSPEQATKMIEIFAGVDAGAPRSGLAQLRRILESDPTAAAKHVLAMLAKGEPEGMSILAKLENKQSSWRTYQLLSAPLRYWELPVLNQLSEDVRLGPVADKLLAMIEGADDVSKRAAQAVVTMLESDRDRGVGRRIVEDLASRHSGQAAMKVLLQVTADAPASASVDSSLSRVWTVMHDRDGVIPVVLIKLGQMLGAPGQAPFARFVLNEIVSDRPDLAQPARSFLRAFGDTRQPLALRVVEALADAPQAQREAIEFVATYGEKNDGLTKVIAEMFLAQEPALRRQAAQLLAVRSNLAFAPGSESLFGDPGKLALLKKVLATMDNAGRSSECLRVFLDPNQTALAKSILSLLDTDGVNAQQAARGLVDAWRQGQREQAPERQKAMDNLEHFLTMLGNPRTRQTAVNALVLVSETASLLPIEMALDAKSADVLAQLIGMRATPEGRQYLGLCFETFRTKEQFRQMFVLSTQPRYAPAREFILSMMAETDDSDATDARRFAVRKLMSLMADQSPNAQAAAQSLLQKLSLPDEQQACFKLLGIGAALTTPAEFFSVMLHPPTVNGALQIERLLASESPSELRLLLSLLSSQDPAAAKLGKQLLGMLNSKEEYAKAWRYLSYEPRFAPPAIADGFD